MAAVVSAVPRTILMFDQSCSSAPNYSHQGTDRGHPCAVTENDSAPPIDLTKLTQFHFVVITDNLPNDLQRSMRKPR